MDGQPDLHRLRITYYSAAAAAMIRRGERCDCGAPLRRIEDEEYVPVGAPESPNGNGHAVDSSPRVRRFARD